MSGLLTKLPTREEIAAERAKRGLTARPLWPKGFDEDTPECAWRFIRELRTWNEANKRDQAFPDRAYLKAHVYEWHECKRTGKTLIEEKCRRMVISWLSRALELHQLGLTRQNHILGGDDLEAAAKHVWRLKHLYMDLRKTHPSWNLPEHTELKYEGEFKLKAFGLANGSICNYANGQSSGLQGDGTAIITLEEFGLYRYPAEMLGQAKHLTRGEAGTVGGFVNIITNASTLPQWQEIKKYLTAEDGYATGRTYPNGMDVRDLPSNERYIQLHHYADPEKDAAWLAQVKLEMRNTPADFRLQILMEDKVVEGALWEREWFDYPGFRLPNAFPRVNGKITFNPPKEVVRVAIALDPSVKDPDKAKRPNKLPDECGVMVVGIDHDGNGYVLGDFTAIRATADWARLSVLLYDLTKATGIIAEKNNGGDLIKEVIRGYSSTVPVQLVHASVGKRARAEPVATLYEMGRVRHCGNLSALESQQCTWDSTNPSHKSPGRIDSLVWGFHGLGLCQATGTRVNDRILKRHKP